MGLQGDSLDNELKQRHVFLENDMRLINYVSR